MAKATHWWVKDWVLKDGIVAVVIALLLSTKQSVRLYEENNGHDYKNDSVGGLGVKHFSQAFN
jgi:hypothetical protein